MSRFSIFRTAKPQQFNYVPRFYDPEKEELKARVDAARPDGEKDSSPEAMKVRIRSGFKTGRMQIDRTFRRKANRKRSYRVALIAIILTVLSYLALRYYWPLIEQYMR